MDLPIPAVLAGDINCYKEPLIDDADEEHKTTSEEPKFRFNFNANVDDPVNKKILTQVVAAMQSVSHGSDTLKFAYCLSLRMPRPARCHIRLSSGPTTMSLR